MPRLTNQTDTHSQLYGFVYKTTKWQCARVPYSVGTHTAQPRPLGVISDVAAQHESSHVISNNPCPVKLCQTCQLRRGRDSLSLRASIRSARHAPSSCARHALCEGRSALRAADLPIRAIVSSIDIVPPRGVSDCALASPAAVRRAWVERQLRRTKPARHAHTRRDGTPRNRPFTALAPPCRAA